MLLVGRKHNKLRTIYGKENHDEGEVSVGKEDKFGQEIVRSPDQ